MRKTKLISNESGILIAEKGCLIVEFKTLPRDIRGWYQLSKSELNYTNDNLIKECVDDYIKVFRKHGYDEAVELPYSYDLEEKCLTVKFGNEFALTSPMAFCC